jgi:pyruvate/2-oxoglutarate dehydrogenase complex dihydrolipoamide dehydrogenase (E3) component
MARVKARADTVSANSRDSVEKWLRGMPGCTVIHDHARFEGPDTIRVGDELLTAPRIFINVGGRAAVPEMPGVSEVPYLTNSSILALDRVPDHLVVVGGSYIGLEFAQMYRRFGADVTVVEKGPRLIAREDEDVSEAIRTILVDEGITVRTEAECIGFGARPEGVAVSVNCRSGSRRSSRRMCFSRSDAIRTQKTLGSTEPASRPTRAATSPSTRPSPPTCRASGLSAIATGAGPSLTPPTMISRSWLPTCSMVSSAG